MTDFGEPLVLAPPTALHPIALPAVVPELDPGTHVEDSPYFQGVGASGAMDARIEVRA
jgi:hypothetical protein